MICDGNIYLFCTHSTTNEENSLLSPEQLRIKALQVFRWAMTKGYLTAARENQSWTGLNRDCSASGKYSQRFTFATFSYVTALFQNGLGILFASKFYKQLSMMTMWKRVVWNLCKLIKNQKTRKAHVHEYWRPLPWHSKLSSCTSFFHWSSLSCNFIGVHRW